jgi:hypothetical protein
MRPRSLQLLIVGVVAALIAAGSVGASAGAQAVSVHVQRKPNVAGNVHVSFRPTDRLPVGGYYYAVLVLKHYKRYTRKAPPPCATSSDMQRTDYGYPHPGRLVRLALTPAKSAAGHWCRGGIYSGGIYAVPHAPPCEGTYPCHAEPYEPPGNLCPGSPHPCYGIVAQPKSYAFPEGLPYPIARGARIIGHFQVTF